MESEHILFLPSWKNECGFRYFQFIIATQRIKSIIQFISRSFHICFWSNGLHVSFYLFIYSFSLFCRECAAVPVLLFQCSCLLLSFFLLTCVKIDSCTSRYYSENRMNNRNLIKSISIKAKTMSALQTDVTEWKLTTDCSKTFKWMNANIYCIALHKMHSNSSSNTPTLNTMRIMCLCGINCNGFGHCQSVSIHLVRSRFLPFGHFALLHCLNAFLNMSASSLRCVCVCVLICVHSKQPPIFR